MLHVDVTVRYRDRVLIARRLTGRTTDRRTPARSAALLLVLGLSIAIVELGLSIRWLLQTGSPLAFSAVLVGAGLVAAAIAIHRRGDADASAFWVGPGAPDLAMELAGVADRHAIVRIDRHDVAIDLPAGFSIIDGEVQDLRADGGHVAVAAGDVVIDVRRSQPEPGTARWGRIDRRFALALTFAAVAIASAIVVAHHVVAEPLSLHTPEDWAAYGRP